MELEKTYIGLDLGGTKLFAARVDRSEILATDHRYLPKDNGDENVVIQLIIDSISSLMNDSVAAIGLGIPSTVDTKRGIVYDVQNIPSWKEVYLAERLQEYFHLPIYLNNDANCYALGEAYYGAGRDVDFFVGLTLGTGLGAGIVYKRKLLEDANGGSGEFGILPYLDATLEDYCSGGFFKRKYHSDGKTMADRVANGDQIAIEAYKEYGKHLGAAIKIVIATLDPKRIILGGSIAQSKDLFENEMRKSLVDFPFPKSIENIEIIFSNTNHMAVLGAASLCFQSENIEV